MKKGVKKLLMIFGLMVLLFLAAGLINQSVKKKSYGTNFAEGQLYKVGESLLYAELGGNPEGVPVVFEAGLGDGAYSWCTYAPTLQKEYQTLVYDKGGIGRSEVSSFTGSLDSEAQELKALLEAIGITRPIVLVGHSRGGVIARRFAQLYPEHVKGILLIDTTNESMFEDSISKAFYKLNSAFYAVLGFSNHFGIPRLLNDLGAPLLEREIDQQIIHARGSDYLAEYNEACYQSSYLKTVSRQTGTVAQILELVQSGPQAQKIPAYIVYEVPRDEEQADTEELVQRCIQAIKQQFPHSESKVVYDAGHYIHVSMPEIITEGIEWLLAQ